MTLDTALRRRISEALDREGGLEADTELNRILASNPDAQAYAEELLALESQLRDWPLPERSDADWEAFAASIEARLDAPLAAIDDPTLPPEASFEAEVSSLEVGTPQPVAVAPLSVRTAATVTNFASRRHAARNKWFGYSALAASLLVASIAGVSVFRDSSTLNAPTEREMVLAPQSAANAFEEAEARRVREALPAAPPALTPPELAPPTAPAVATAAAPASPANEYAREAASRSSASGSAGLRFSDGFDDDEGTLGGAVREGGAIGRARGLAEPENRRPSAPEPTAAPATRAPSFAAAGSAASPTAAPRAGSGQASPQSSAEVFASADPAGPASSPAPSSPSRARRQESEEREAPGALNADSESDVASLPRTLSESAARAVFVRMQPQVAACLRPSGTDAVGVSVDVVGATGAVTAARISGGAAGSSEGACVERVLRGASFPRFEADRATFAHTFVVATPESMRRHQDSMESSF